MIKLVLLRQGESLNAGFAQTTWPLTECLKDTVARFLPFWNDTIALGVAQGKKVIIAAHGNTLRALVMHLDGIAPEKITTTEIPTGIPLVYELGDRLRPIKSCYLGDPDRARQSMTTEQKKTT